MKKIGTFISIICIINVLMMAGFAGFLWATGRLDKPKAQAIGDLLRQQGTPDGLRAKLYDIMTPATAPATQTQPATATAPGLANSEGETPATAQERIDYVQKMLDQERLRLDAEAQKVQHDKEDVADQMKKLQALTDQLDAREKADQAKLVAAGSKNDEAGFERTMAIFDELKSKQVKDLLMAMSPDDIARYIVGMEPDQAAKIIGEFKSPEEKTLINGVLDKIRGAKSGAGTGAASGSPATSQPAVADSAGNAANAVMPAP